MRELYALIVGEAGIDPRYFLHSMTADEAADFLEGYRRRTRVMWEVARVGWYLNVSERNKDMTELFPFAWDEKPKAKRVTKKQQDDLRKRAEALMKRIKDNGSE